MNANLIAPNAIETLDRFTKGGLGEALDIAQRHDVPLNVEVEPGEGGGEAFSVTLSAPLGDGRFAVLAAYRTQKDHAAAPLLWNIHLEDLCASAGARVARVGRGLDAIERGEDPEPLREARSGN